MTKIYTCAGEYNDSMFEGVKALLSFGESSKLTTIKMTKHFGLDEARKGLEQLKRWVSTGSFKCVVLEGFVNALLKGNTSHIIEWLSDHSSEPDFPTLILVGDEDVSAISSISEALDGDERLKGLINA